MRKAPGGKSGRRIEETSGEYEEKTRTSGNRKREVDARLTVVETREKQRGDTGQGGVYESKRGPNVVVTGDVALPDDISPRNYLSVQRDSARRLPVLMPADNVPIVS